MSLDREIGEIKVTVQNIERLLIVQNGRVKKAENAIESLRWWQAAVAGGGSAIGFVIGVFAAFWDKLTH